MTRYAWVNAANSCPSCGEVVQSLVWFSWGGLLTEDPKRGPVYAIGDHLLWFTNREGRVESDGYWEYVRNDEQPSDPLQREGINLGDPRLLNVDVYEEREVPAACSSCDLPLHRSCVTVRHGIVRAVSLVPVGVVADELHVTVYDADGTSVVEYREDRPIHRMASPPLLG